MSEKKHILEGAPEMIVGEFAPLFGTIGRNKNAMAQDARDRICRVVAKAEVQFDAIHHLIDQCAAEVPNFKPYVRGAGTDVQVANLVAFLRSELEAEKLNTAQMVAISNERERLKADLQALELTIANAADRVFGSAGETAQQDVKYLERLAVQERDLESLETQLGTMQRERDEALEQLAQARASAGVSADVHGALLRLAEFAGVRTLKDLSPLELIGKITDSLKAVMTAHDEDMRRIWELKRVHKDRAEWGRTIGHALDALPDSVKASLGDMTCVPECIQRLGRLAEDTLLYQAQVEGLNRAVAGLQAEVGPLRQRLNDAQRRADYGRRLYEAERDHCARIVAVLNDAQVLTDLNELPF